MLKGKRTFIIGILMVIFNGVGIYLNSQDPTTGLETNTAIQGILTALGLMGLRAGIGNLPK